MCEYNCIDKNKCPECSNELKEYDADYTDFSTICNEEHYILELERPQE